MPLAEILIQGAAVSVPVRLDDIGRLETDGQLDRAYVTLVELVEETDDVTAIVRLAFLCWYAITEPVEDYYGPFGVSGDELSGVLQRATQSLLENHEDDPTANWLLGYIVGITPNEFGDFEEWDKRAPEFSWKAHEIDSTDPVFEMGHLGHGRHRDSEWRTIQEAAAPVVQRRFAGPGIMNEYFREVLSPSDYPDED